MNGGLAVAVPGALRGYRALLDTFGTSLEWSVLFEDAIQLARNGFPLGFFQADALKSLEHDIFTNENMRNVYWNTRTNTTYKEGETLVQKDLADTLENIAKQGVDYFYEGEFAQGMIEEIQKQKGLMTTADLSSYKVVWNRTTTARLSGGSVLHSVPPPGSGAVLAHILGIMDGYRDNATGRLADDSLTAHRFVESCKFAYAKRSQLGDSAFVDVTKLVDQMTSSDHADRTRKKIRDDKTFGPSYYSGLRAFKQDHGTSHLSLLDENGDAIAVTATINTYFGSQVVFRGVVLNNHMDDFSIPGESNAWGLSSSEPNYIRPGKRPMSSTAPSVVVDRNGDVELVLGGSGGAKITSAVAWASMRCLWQDRTIKDAIDSPRIHHQWLPNEVDVEQNFSEVTIKYLEQTGHKVVVSSGPLSFLGGIERWNGRIFANYDFRRGGSSDGD
ncbi:scoloptoxin SSD14 [Ixodes scapularis]